MPRPRRSYGRPRTAVFPPDWQATHAAVIDTTLDHVIRIAAAGTERHFDEDLGRTVTIPATPVYEGPAAIGLASVTGRGASTVVDEPVASRRYEITLPVDVADIDPDIHFVHVETSPDPDLVGARLTVEDLERGGRRFSRVVYATLTD